MAQSHTVVSWFNNAMSYDSLGDSLGHDGGLNAFCPCSSIQLDGYVVARACSTFPFGVPGKSLRCCGSMLFAE